MNVLFLPKYSRLAASTRQRVLQYIPFLESAGITCQVSPFFSDEYLKKKFYKNSVDIVEVVFLFARRLKALLSSKKYDLIVIYMELAPYFPPLFERILRSVGVPYIVDYDDAIFHQYENSQIRIVRLLFQNKIKSVMKHATAVIAGNEYLAEYARQVNKNVTVIPTVVAIEKFKPLKMNKDEYFTVGWIGSPSTSKYLKLLEPIFEKFMSDAKTRLLLVGSGNVSFRGVKPILRQWSEHREVEDINSFDVGIMPLDNTPWEQGKSGFKLIQYMSCGVPVIASPIGMNREIVQDGVNGLLANSEADWLEKLSILKNDHQLRKRLVTAGRKSVEERYSLQAWAPEYLKVINKAICAG